MERTIKPDQAQTTKAKTCKTNYEFCTIWNYWTISIATNDCLPVFVEEIAYSTKENKSFENSEFKHYADIWVRPRLCGVELTPNGRRKNDTHTRWWWCSCMPFFGGRCVVETAISITAACAAVVFCSFPMRTRREMATRRDPEPHTRLGWQKWGLVGQHTCLALTANTNTSVCVLSDVVWALLLWGVVFDQVGRCLMGVYDGYNVVNWIGFVCRMWHTTINNTAGYSRPLRVLLSVAQKLYK